MNNFDLVKLKILLKATPFVKKMSLNRASSNDHSAVVVIETE